MGKTVRFNPEQKGGKGVQFRHPRRNRAIKGEARPKGSLPSSFDDVDFSAYEENWHNRHPEVASFDPPLKRNKSRWRSESKKMRREDIFVRSISQLGPIRNLRMTGTLDSSAKRENFLSFHTFMTSEEYPSKISAQIHTQILRTPTPDYRYERTGET